MPGVRDIRPVLDVISLKVRDGEKSAMFYVDYLGLELLVEENDIAYLGSRQTGKALIALYEFAEGTESGQLKNALARFSLTVPSQEAFNRIHTRLMAADYSFENLTSISGHQVIRVADPEGHILDLINVCVPDNGFEEAVMLTDQGTIRPAFTEEKPPQTSQDLSIHAVRLSVRNVSVSQYFYAEILGFSEEIDEKGLKLTTGDQVSDYLRLADSDQEIATDDDYFGLDYLAFRVPMEDDLKRYAQRLVAKEQDFYYNKKQGLIQIDDPDGNHLWFYQ